MMQKVRIQRQMKMAKVLLKMKRQKDHRIEYNCLEKSKDQKLSMII